MKGLIAVYWGPAEIRAYLLTSDGELNEKKVKTGCGVFDFEENTPEEKWEEVLESVLKPWLRMRWQVMVLISGTICGREGWKKLPPISCPATIADIASGIVEHTTPGGWRCGFVPGLDGGKDGNFWEGEETLIFGSLAKLGAPLVPQEDAAEEGANAVPSGLEIGGGDENGTTTDDFEAKLDRVESESSLEFDEEEKPPPPDDRWVLCVPGEEGRWVLVDNGRISWTACFMTGEIFSLITQHAMQGVFPNIPGRDPITGVAGWERAYEKGLGLVDVPGGLMHHLWTFRREKDSPKVPRPHMKAYLAGLFVSQEVREAVGCVCKKLDIESPFKQQDASMVQDAAQQEGDGLDDLGNLGIVEAAEVKKSEPPLDWKEVAALPVLERIVMIGSGALLPLYKIAVEKTVGIGSVSPLPDDTIPTGLFSIAQHFGPAHFGDFEPPPPCLEEYFESSVSVIASLRGVNPDNCVEVATAIYEEGITVFEVPLNQPDALECIYKLSLALGEVALIGAGTVLTHDVVKTVHNKGGNMICAPHSDVNIIDAAKDLQMVVLTGFASPPEAFRMIEAGVDALRMFPIENNPPQVLRSVRSVVPQSAKLLPVGEIDKGLMEDYWRSGADGFGVTHLYSPSATMTEIKRNARAVVAAYKDLGTFTPKWPRT